MIVLPTVFTCESDICIFIRMHTLVTGWEHPPCSSKSDKINITLVRKVIITSTWSCDEYANIKMCKTAIQTHYNLMPLTTVI